MHQCNTCIQLKQVDCFHKNKISPSGLDYNCKSCKSSLAKSRNKLNKEHRSDVQKKYYFNNKESVKEKQAQYYRNNKDKKIKQQQEYQKNRKQYDPLFKVISVLRKRIYSALNSKKWHKNSPYSDYVGCSQDQLKLHIETQFQSGMSWNNYGHSTWHIDHKVPLATAKTEEEVYKLCHYTNLQPMWAKDNFSKGSKNVV